MKKNSIFSIVRNGLYEQYLKLITNIDVNCQNESTLITKMVKDCLHYTIVHSIVIFVLQSYY